MSAENGLHDRQTERYEHEFQALLPSLCSPMVAVVDPSENVVDEAHGCQLFFRSCSWVILAAG